MKRGPSKGYKPEFRPFPGPVLTETDTSKNYLNVFNK